MAQVAVKEYHLRELDLNTIKPNPFTKVEDGGSKIAVIGKPDTGKSTVIKAILHSKRDIIPVAQIFSGTEGSNGFFSGFNPKSFIYHNMDQQVIERFLTRQKAARKYLQNPWAALIIDDCADDKTNLNSAVMRRIFKMGRHYAMLTILSLQYAMDVSTTIRTAVDGTFILRETNPMTRKRLFENFCCCSGALSSQEDFNAMLDDVCQDYTALYINNRIQSSEISDCVFWFKPDINALSDFQFGSVLTRQFNDVMYEPECEDSLF